MMQTEYAEKYITLGLKIAYYRKSVVIRRRFSRKRSERASIFLRRSKVREQCAA